MYREESASVDSLLARCRQGRGCELLAGGLVSDFAWSELELVPIVRFDRRADGQFHTKVDGVLHEDACNASSDNNDLKVPHPRGPWQNDREEARYDVAPQNGI